MIRCAFCDSAMMALEINGQLAVDAGEQEAPPMLKLSHTA